MLQFINIYQPEIIWEYVNIKREKGGKRMIQVADGFRYQGSKPLDERLKYDSIADMKAVSESALYDGCLAYVTAEKKYYSYDSSNTVDVTLGKWREFEAGGGGTTYTSGDGITISEQDVISTNNASSEDIAEIVYPLPSSMNRLLKYSTTEQVIGVWIDGKTIYQKTFNVSSPSAKNEYVTVADLSSLNIGTVCDINAILKIGSNMYKKLSNYNSTGSNNISSVWVSGTNLRCCVISDEEKSQTLYVTLQYTKTS